MELLKGHDSQETAYLVNDYPYGFTLRCQIRYWLEYSPAHGFRFCSQTTNPKRAGTHWNAPKKSTYCKFGAVMFLNEENHVKWSGLHEYTNAAESRGWLEKYRAGLSDKALEIATKWTEDKEFFELDPSTFKKRWIEREAAKMRAENEANKSVAA